MEQFLTRSRALFEEEGWSSRKQVDYEEPREDTTATDGTERKPVARKSWSFRRFQFDGSKDPEVIPSNETEPESGDAN